MSRKPMTVEEAADYLGLTERAVADEIRRGRMPHFRIANRRIRITEAQCIEYMERHPCNGEDDGDAMAVAT